MENQVYRIEADVTLPQVTIEIGGKERSMRYDMSAIALVEKKTGLNLFNEVLDAPTGTTTAWLLYAALLPGDPDLTYQEVLGWVTMRNRLVLLEVVRAAWMGSNSEPVGDAAGEAEAQAQPQA